MPIQVKSRQSLPTKSIKLTKSNSNSWRSNLNARIVIVMTKVKRPSRKPMIRWDIKLWNQVGNYQREEKGNHRSLCKHCTLRRNFWVKNQLRDMSTTNTCNRRKIQKENWVLPLWFDIIINDRKNITI